jgi:hypothetical protein
MYLTVPVNTIPNKQDILMSSLSEYFQHTQHIDLILPIINGTSQISLRIIDWFVTNYAKKNNTRIISTFCDDKPSDNINVKQFLVFLNYKSQLKAYTKKQFDPFCRRERINFFYHPIDKTKSFVTTVGQLNFFRWAIKNRVIDYIENNLASIEQDMNSSIRKAYNNNKSPGERRRRQELSISATKTINKHQVSITVNFE